MLVSFLLWSTSLQDRPISLELRAARLENAVPEIAEKTGLDLDVDHEIKDLVVVIKVKERPAKSLLRLVGEQVNARWLEKDDGSLVLTRVSEDVAVQQAQQRALERQGIEAIKRRLREEIGDGAFTVQDVERFVAELEKVNKPPANGQGMSLDGPRLAAPGSRLAKQILLTTSTDDLLSVKQGVGLTVSDSPNRLQQKANAKTLEAITQFWKNVQLFVDHKAALVGTSRGTGIDKEVVELEMPGSGPGKTIASVSRTNSSLSAYVRSYAANGDLLTSGFTLGESVLPPYKLPANLTAIPRTKIALTPATQLMQDFHTGRISLEGEFDPESKEAKLLSLLYDPEDKDPLSFLATDAFFAWADALDLELVAHLPAFFDRYVRRFRTDSEFDLSQLWSELERIRTIRVEEREGVIVVRPVTDSISYLDKGYAERLGRLNRGLAKFEDRLDVVAEFLAETHRATGDSGHGQLELMAWSAADVIPMDWNQQGQYPLTVLGHIPRSMRHQLRDGSAFAVRDLPADVRKALDAIVGRWNWSSAAVPSTHLSMEPDEHFPSGIPLDTEFVVTLASDVDLVSVHEVQFGDGLRSMKSTSSLQRIAQDLRDPDRHRKLNPNLYTLSLSKGLRVARVQVVTFKLTARDGTFATMTLRVPLERSVPTDLTPEQLAEKYFGG